MKDFATSNTALSESFSLWYEAHLTKFTHPDISLAAYRYFESARPDFIGWGWCGWMDQWESAEPVKQHDGLQDAFGNWHQPLADRMA